MIEVRHTGEGDPLAFEVVVRTGGSETRHRVTVAQATCERLTGGRHVPEALLEAAFRFLLPPGILAQITVTGGPTAWQGIPLAGHDRDEVLLECAGDHTVSFPVHGWSVPSQREQEPS